MIARDTASLRGAVFGDVGGPQPIRRAGGEVAPDQVVVDRRTGLPAVAAAFLTERAPPAHRGADPPRCPTRHRQAGVAGLVGEEPVAELWVVAVGVEQRVRPMSPLKFCTGDWPLEQRLGWTPRSLAIWSPSHRAHGRERSARHRRGTPGISPGIGLEHSDILPAHHLGKPTRTSPTRAVDPFAGTIRREATERLLIINGHHLRTVLIQHAAHYNHRRAHQELQLSHHDRTSRSKSRATRRYAADLSSAA